MSCFGAAETRPGNNYRRGSAHAGGLMEEKILKLLRRPDYTPLNFPELLRRLGLPAHQQRQLDEALRHLERSGQIARIKQGNRYALPIEADLIPGRIRMNRQG